MLDEPSETSRFKEPDPESFRPTPRPPPTAFQRPPEPGSSLLGAMAAAAMLLISTAAWSTALSARLAVTYDDLFHPVRWWRFASALFMHGDLDHWLHNAPPFVFFAWLLRGYFGRVAFPILGLLGGMVSNVYTVWYYGDRTQLIGASGIVYSMVGTWLVLYIWFDRTVATSQRVMRAVAFALALFFPKTFEPRVSYAAHLVGFLSGGGMAFALIPLFKRHAPVVKRQSNESPPALEES